MNVGRYLIVMAIAAVASLVAYHWSRGSSVFRFESPYWDLGLLPILAALLVGACLFRGSGGRRRRFLLGFEAGGWAAVVGYIVSCSRPAKWSLVSALLPFQTGYQLAPGRSTTWRDLRPWGIFVDTVTLVSLPLLVGALGGAVCSVRLTLRRLMVAVAVMAVLLGGLVDTIRRARHHDRMAQDHRRQIVGVLRGRQRPDGTVVFEPTSKDRAGKAVSERQQRLDRWHEAMARRYWHASPYPWSRPPEILPPPE